MTRSNLAMISLISIAMTLFIAVSSFCQPKKIISKNGTIIVPLDLTTQRPILELKINGKGPYRFIFDTGSSGSVIDETLATELGLEVVGEDPMGTPGSDNVIMSKRVMAPSVTIVGTDIVKDLEVNTLGLKKMLPVDGILNPNFFSEYLVTLDYPNSNLDLDIGELNKFDKNVVAFLQKERVINLDITVDGNKVEAHLDTGNPGGFAIPYALKDKLKFKENPVERGVASTPAATFTKYEAKLAGKIEVGGVTFSDPDVVLLDGIHFANLGYQIYKDLRVTIDRKNSLIRFERGAPAVVKKIVEPEPGEQNDYTGWYGGHERRIFIENGEMYLQRGGAPKLKLVLVKGDEFKMLFPMPVDNELPNVRFERDTSKKVTGFTFLFKDGREDVVKRD